MKKAANVILQGAQPSSGRTSRTGNQRAPSPKTETPLSKTRSVVDPQKAFPSPKSGHTVTSRPTSRRSPFPEHISRERNEQNQQWLSLSHADQSADNEQQSMLASVMLEPEHQRKLREIVDVQLGASHRPSARPLVSPARAPPPVSPHYTAATLPQPAHFEDGNGGESDDGAGSDRTSALWHTSAHNMQQQPLLLLDESVLQSLSLEEMLSVQRHLQQAIERRANNSNVAGYGVLSPTAVTGSAATPVLVVDAAAVEQRRHLRRSGSRSGTNGDSSAFGLPNTQNLHSSPSQPLRSTSTSSYAAQQEEEGEDPELQSVHSDADQRLNAMALSGIDASASTFTQNPRPPSSLSGSLHGHTAQVGTGNSGGRVSRTNGALLPHHKMLYGPRIQQALPCLSPFTDSSNAQAVNRNDVMSNNCTNTPSPSIMESFSRSSSRPPSRSSTSAAAHLHPLNASLQQGGTSQSMAWSLSPTGDCYLDEHYNTQNSASSAAVGTAGVGTSGGRAALLLEVVHAHEGVPASSALTAALQQQPAAAAPSLAETTLPLAQFLQQQRRQYIDNPLVLSPSSAFDDLSTTGGSFTSYQSQRSLASSSGPQNQSRVSAARRKNSTGSGGSDGLQSFPLTSNVGQGQSQIAAGSGKHGRARSSNHKGQGVLPTVPLSATASPNGGIASLAPPVSTGMSNRI